MKRKSVLDGNRMFLLSILASQFLTPAVFLLGVQDAMVLQFLIEFFMLLPCLIYLLLQKRSLKETLGIASLTWKQWLLLIPLAMCMDKVATLVNLLSMLFAENTVSNHMTELVLQYPMPLVFFVVAVTPMICEEAVFRGVIYRGYRLKSICGAIFLSAFLFGIMHMNLNQFCYAFVLGVLFCLINEAAGSILPSMMMHLYINGKSVILLYGAVEFLKELRVRYTAAEAAGNAELMESLLADAQGIPINQPDWLAAYMNMGAADIPEAILNELPGVLSAVLVMSLILWYFLKSTGRTEHFKQIFRRRETEAGEETEARVSFISPSLVIGCAICILVMLTELM